MERSTSATRRTRPRTDAARAIRRRTGGGLPARPPRATVPILALLLLGTACVEAGDAARWATTVDTLPGGRLHVVNTPPPSGVEPTWRIEEELRIGSVEAEGPAVFGQVKGLGVTSDGRIAVLDAQAQELRVFDPGGGHLATWGGRGAGPGELEGAHGLMVGPGDSLWVPDVDNARMSVFHPSSGFARSARMPFLRWGFVWSGIVTREGTVWKPSTTLGEPRRPVIRVYGRAGEDAVARELLDVTLESDFALLDSIPLPAEPEADPEDPPGAFYWEAPGGLPRGYIGVPFHAEGQLLLDPRGVIWSKAPGPAYRITRWMPGGDTTLVLETRREPVPVTAAERDSAIDRVSGMLRERGIGVRQDWSKIPENKPAIVSMFLADGGRLWVRTSSPDSLVTYDVYERDGRWAGTAVTALKPWRWVDPIVRDDRFWAVVTDELDIPYVVRARITPPR